MAMAQDKRSAASGGAAAPHGTQPLDTPSAARGPLLDTASSARGAQGAPSTAGQAVENRQAVPPSSEVSYSGRRPFFKSLVYGRTILNALLIALQLFTLALFFVRIPQWLLSNVAYRNIGLLAAQYLLAAAFLVYLANSKGRGEYKLAWLVPVLIFPIFGIVCYILTHRQGLPRAVKRRLAMKNGSMLAQRLPAYQGAVPSTADNSSAKGAAYQSGGASGTTYQGAGAGGMAKTAKAERNPYPKVDGITRYLKQEGHHDFYTDCDVTYYASGEAAFPVILEKLRAASSFIFMEFFLIKKGWMWSRILETLVEKAASGVEVRLIFDALGSITLPTKKTVNELRKAGIRVQAFAPMVPFFSPYLNNRDHRKIIVIDGLAAFTGGINIGDEYIGRDNRLGKWKDNALLVRGAAVASFTQMFLNLWDVIDLPPSVPPAMQGESISYYPEKVRTFIAPGIVLPYCDDAYNGKDIAENVYLYVIDNAVKSIHITTPYVALSSRLQESLLFAAARGVEVAIIVPRSIDHYLTYCIGRTYLEELSAGGVEVYEYSPGFIHSKVIIADGDSAVVGTVNFDFRSLFAQFEDAVFIHKGNATYEIEMDFKRTKEECILLTGEAYKKLPAIERAMGYVGRLFAPLV